MSDPGPVQPSTPGTALTVWGVVLLILGGIGAFIGVVWIVVYYLTQSALPIAALGDANILVGAFFVITALPLLIVGIVLSVLGSSKRRAALRGPAAQ